MHWLVDIDADREILTRCHGGLNGVNLGITIAHGATVKNTTRSTDRVKPQRASITVVAMQREGHGIARAHLGAGIRDTIGIDLHDGEI